MSIYEYYLFKFIDESISASQNFYSHSNMAAAAASINNLEDEIARLEKELSDSDSDGSSTDSKTSGKDSNSSESSESSSECSDTDESKESTKEIIRLEDPDLEPIQGLPGHLLPEGQGYAGKEQKRVRKRKRDADAPAIRCTICDVAVGSLQQLDEHREGKKHMEKLQEMAGADYQRTAGRPFWCRSCQLQSIDLEAFNAHRASREHKEKQKDEKTLNNCLLCNKQFTSVLQLEEHKNGKWHIQREAQRMENRGKGRGDRGRGRGVGYQSGSRGRGRGRGRGTRGKGKGRW
jgi:hypothetical protein